ncbi:hypothetical protein TPE_2710 [Treponema pedis str. T A4]|uniref:Lipoprotein LPP20-like domain-containing protein n=2 Tax=Treponema pedis TaxID=409322 RepID=S5ZR80_9SPIR|nr:hypothetical protein TPE_2710 [Treponema pedis str. T A4]
MQLKIKPMPQLNKKNIFIISFSVTLLIFSCATNSEIKTNGNIPDWVLNVPKADSQYEYFTASGTNKNLTLAENDAKNNLIGEVLKIFGVSVKANTTSILSGDINNIDKIIEREIKQYSGANIKGLKIKERYIEKNISDSTVYLLAAYDKTELQKEKMRLLHLAEEKTNAVNIPVKNAEKFYSEKKYFAAAYNYVQAACAAFNFKLENAEIKFEADIKNAKQSLKKIELKPATKVSVQGKSGKFLPAFKINCFEEELPLIVTYTIKYVSAGAKQKIFTEKIEAGTDGIAEFILPLQESACTGTVKIETDIEELRKMLKDTNEHFAEKEINELKKIAVKSAVGFNYTIEQEKETQFIQNKKVDVFAEQYGKDGKRLIKSETEKAVVEILQKMNFDAKKINSKNSFAEFIICAVVSIDNIEIIDSGVFAKLTAEVEIHNLKTGEIIYAQDISKRGAGFSETEAVSSASFALAKQIASVFAAKTE